MTHPRLYDNDYFERMRGGSATCGAYSGKLHEGFLKLAPTGRLGQMRVLDAGCGRGELMTLLEQAGVDEVWGVDFSPAAVALTRKRLAGSSNACHILEGSLENPALLPAGHFDLIFMTDVVEHLPASSLSQTLHNVHHWLCKGGLLIIHTFPTLTLHRLFRFYLKLRGEHSSLVQLDEIHCNVQTRKRLQQSLRTAGFTVQRLWLQNDFAETSSVYQSMKPGWKRTITNIVFNKLLKSTACIAIARIISAEELILPSIYCVSSKD